MKNQINKINIQPILVPSLCKKCGKGTMEAKSGGRVYVCNNPKCGRGIWFNFVNDNLIK